MLESGKLISVEFARHKDTAGELLYPNDILTSEEIILEDIVMINHYKFGLTAKIDPLSKITRTWKSIAPPSPISEKGGM